MYDSSECYKKTATATTTAAEMGLLPSSFRPLFPVIVHPTQQQQEEAVTTALAMIDTTAMDVVLPPLLRQSFPLSTEETKKRSNTIKKFNNKFYISL